MQSYSSPLLHQNILLLPSTIHLSHIILPFIPLDVEIFILGSFGVQKISTIPFFLGLATSFIRHAFFNPAALASYSAPLDNRSNCFPFTTVSLTTSISISTTCSTNYLLSFSLFLPLVKVTTVEVNSVSRVAFGFLPISQIFLKMYLNTSFNIFSMLSIFSRSKF